MRVGPSTGAALTWFTGFCAALNLQLHLRRHLGYVFITTAGKIHENELIRCHLRRSLDEFGNGMRGLEGGNDTLQACQSYERFERRAVLDVGVFDSLLVAQPGVLRTDGGIIQARRDAVGELDLAVLVLQQ